jgi:hypothetical protein
VSHPPRKARLKSLADYLIHYDLTAMIAEAKADYSQSATGSPRLLEQKDISARFRKQRPSKKTAE